MKHLSPADATPRELGFAMPAEWEPHAATWMAWPADDDLWFGHLAGVRGEFAQLVSTIARFEPVHLLVRDDESEQDARARLQGANVKFHRVASDDVWMRDNGPIFVRRKVESGKWEAGKDQPEANASATTDHLPLTTYEIALVNWKFNAWGGKFEYQNDDKVPEYVAGALNMPHWDINIVLEGGGLEIGAGGVALTTRSCLLTDTRNPGLTEEGYTFLLNDMLGVKKLLWLDGGLENDHTDGHIDTITRFAGPRTIVTSVEADPDDANHATMQRNLEALRGMTDAAGQPFEVVELPLPADYLEGAEGRLPPTYANFYIGNGFVVVPQYGDPNDARALEILTPLFPGREVIGLPSRQIIEGGGSFHCVTQQQPAGAVWNGE